MANYPLFADLLLLGVHNALGTDSLDISDTNDYSRHFQNAGTIKINELLDEGMN